MTSTEGAPSRYSELPNEDLILYTWRTRWALQSRDKQRPPAGDWATWFIRAGRGFGKTRTGAEWLGEQAASHPKSIWHVISPTHDDVRSVCFEGPAGLLNVIPRELIVRTNLSLPLIELWNGSIIRGFAADTPERLRGPQCMGGWLDEISAWRYAQQTWDMYQMGLRLGPNPRTVVTGTPKPTPFIRALHKEKGVVVTIGTTYENKPNLAPKFFEQLTKYEGTVIGRQELLAELLDPEDSGYIKRRDWRLWPSSDPLPHFKFIVMSLDTAFTEDTFDKKEQTTDPTACSVWGMFEIDGLMNVLLLDAWEEHLGFPALLARVKAERLNKYGAPDMLLHDGKQPLYGKPLVGKPTLEGKSIDLVLIEDKGSGISLRQSLAVENVLTFPYNPGNMDKLARLHAASPAFAQRRVWAVESNKRAGEVRSWAEPLVSQVCTYIGEGSVEHDDLLDTTTQALKYFMDRFFGPMTLPPKTAEQKVEDEVASRRRHSSVRSAYG